LVLHGKYTKMKSKTQLLPNIDQESIHWDEFLTMTCI